MYASGYYQIPMGTPPKASDPTSKFFYPRLGRKNSPPLIPGYFTPPDSRENSPSLRGGSPNPQSRTNSPLPLYARDGSPTPSYNSGSISVRSSTKILSGSKFQRVYPPAPQRENSFSSLQSTPEPIEIAIPPVTQLPGTHGTFGRADSHHHQKFLAPPSPPESVNYSNSPKHRYHKSDASTIIPLPSTVYVPGVGDTVSSIESLGSDQERDSYYYSHGRDRSVSDPTTKFSAIYQTPPGSLKSPSTSPLLPQEPEIPAAAPHFPLQYQSSGMASVQAELAGLWNSAEGTRRGAVKPKDSGKTYILNMYRQAPLYEPQQSEHPLVFPEHFTFGHNAQTPFYSIHAMRENPGDNTFNELSLLRRDPITGLDTSVITLGLEPPSRRISPAGDGLITLIYPKEAVLSAMSPKTPTVPSKADKVLGPRRKRCDEERAREAIQRAYATECCRLSWNSQRRRYYLYHPGIGNGGDAYLVEIEGEVGFDNLGAKGSIKLINVDTNETFTELDFARKMLFVNTRATSKIPSDHIVDVAVSTVLTVATVEGRRMRMVRRTQSEYPNLPASRHISHQYTEKRKRGCISSFFRSLCF